jgi:hypothetical protein
LKTPCKQKGFVRLKRLDLLSFAKQLICIWKQFPEEASMLNHLSTRQVETALEWLASPVLVPPPQELESLSQVEWFLLGKMLNQLLEEKQSQPLQ